MWFWPFCVRWHRYLYFLGVALYCNVCKDASGQTRDVNLSFVCLCKDIEMLYCSMAVWHKRINNNTHNHTHNHSGEKWGFPESNFAENLSGSPVICFFPIYVRGTNNTSRKQASESPVKLRIRYTVTQMSIYVTDWKLCRALFMQTN